MDSTAASTCFAKLPAVEPASNRVLPFSLLLDFSASTFLAKELVTWMGQPEFHCKIFFKLCDIGLEKDAYVEVTIHDVCKVLECGWIDEKCGNEIDLSLEIWVFGELILPAVWYAALTKFA